MLPCAIANSCYTHTFLESYLILKANIINDKSWGGAGGGKEFAGSQHV